MDFSQATAYVLERVGAPSTLVLKKEPVSVVRAVYEGRDVFVWLGLGSPSVTIDDYSAIIIIYAVTNC